VSSLKPAKERKASRTREDYNKRHCKEKVYNEEGNYIKQRAVTVTVAAKTEVEASTKGIKGGEDEEVTPESSKTSIDNCDVNIDIIDNFVIISSSRKNSAAAAVSIKGNDDAMASVQQVKRTPKKKSNKKKDFTICSK
jgi:hypothetical protein